MVDTMLKKLQLILDELQVNQVKLENKVNKNDELIERYSNLVETFKYCAVHLTYYYLTNDDNEDVKNAVEIMSNWVYDNYNEIEC